MSNWRPILRLARRDARRHLTRTLLAALLIALPITALTGFVSVSNPGTPSRERALEAIPQGAQAVITATAIPRIGAPFAQIPEGAPGTWLDDPDTVPASRAEIAGVLSADLELAEYWHSPPLAASADLGLAPGEQHDGSDSAEHLADVDLGRLAMVELREAEPGAFALLAPAAAVGNSPAGADEALVSRALADRLQITVGDLLGFVAPPDSGTRGLDGNAAAAMQDSMRGYRVSGIAEDESYTAWALNGWLAELVAASPQGVQGHWLALGDEPVTWQQAKMLNKLQAFAASRHVLENYPSSDELYPVSIDPVTYLEALVGVVLTLTIGGMLVLFLVTPALAISAEQSRRTLGLAAAAGATPGDLRRVILAQGLVIGVGGGLLGALLGLTVSLGFGSWLGAMDAESGVYGIDSALAGFPWWTLAAGFAIAVLLGLIAALGPANSVARLVPVDALRDRRPAAGARHGRRVSLIVGLGLLVAGLVAGMTTLLVPVPQYPADAAAQLFPPGTPPPGSAVLVAMVGFAVFATAVGLALAIRGLLPRIGRFGARSRPAWRLALRDTADHPSRTVPAVLGVTFSLLAAAYLIVLVASANADYRTTSGTLDWRGTFFVAPKVSVSPEFDRALATAIFEEMADRVPQVTGSYPVEAVDRGSTIWVEPLPPAGRECPQWQVPHASAAREVGAPLRCVSHLSGAQFSSGMRIGSPFSTWDQPLLIDGTTLLATRVPGAEAAAQVLDQGGVVVSDATLLDDDGMVRLAIGPFDEDGGRLVKAEREIVVPGEFLRGAGVAFIMSPDTARDLGVDRIAFAGLLAQTSEPIDGSTLRTLWRMDVGDLALIQTPDAEDEFGASADPVSRALRWGPIALLALVAVAAAAVSVLLSATQGRRDAATAHAVGADRAMLVRLGLAKAGVILVLGVPLGIGSGIALGAYQVAWNRRLQASGAWLDTVVVWDVQLVVGAAVLVAGLLAALILARPPRDILRRSLD